jgi:hypothetical protein
MSSVLSSPDTIGVVIALIVAITQWVRVDMQQKQQALQERKLANLDAKQDRTLGLVAKHEGQLNGPSPTGSLVLPGSSSPVSGNVETGPSPGSDVGTGYQL